MPEPLINPREDETFLADQREVEAALVYARRFGTTEPIRDRVEAGEVADAIKGLAGARKAADGHRLELSAPYRATTESINGHYRELLSSMDAAEKALKRRALDFTQREKEEADRRRREQQERLDREAEEKAAAAQAAAEAAEAEPESAEAQQAAGEAHREAAVAATATAAPVTAPRQLRGDFAALSARTDYRYEIVAPDEVPAEHLTVNEKSIKAAIRAERQLAKAQDRDFNLQLIPGVRIWPEAVGVSR